jgi:hypothetical protein
MKHQNTTVVKREAVKTMIKKIWKTTLSTLKGKEGFVVTREVSASPQRQRGKKRDRKKLNKLVRNAHFKEGREKKIWNGEKKKIREAYREINGQEIEREVSEVVGFEPEADERVIGD